MPITIDHTETAAFAASNPYGDYPRQVVVDFGRPSLRYSVGMRDIIYWTAYRFDSGDLECTNHRTASVLRAIAEEFYPYSEDDADYIREDLEDLGETVEFEFEESAAPTVDVRLLGLVDGFAFFSPTFSEVLWSDEESTPVLTRNAKKFVDFEFPTTAADRFGIRGVRVFSLDLIHWAKSEIDLGEMAFQDEEAWLDTFELSRNRSEANHRSRFDAKLRSRFGDDLVDEQPERSVTGKATDEEADRVLKELAVLL